MGEYARYKGSEVKIGTCEDMYYLRFDQRGKIAGYAFDADVLDVVRFRFPFPDEDETEPGSFEDFDRGLTLWGFDQPAEVDHGTVQFSARNGYLVSLPCPEDSERPGGQGGVYRLGTCEPGANNGLHKLTIHRNGYGGPAALVQQALRGGQLVGIARCNGCGTPYRLEDGYQETAAVSIRNQADDQIRTADQQGTEGNREIGRRFHETADRLLAGYR